MRLITVIGARPQFIKSTVVSKELSNIGIEELSLHTGQHYDQNMSGVFFNELNMKMPDIQLSVGSGGHGHQTGRMLIDIEEVFLEKKPDGCIVYGDTNSTLAGALVASKLHIPVFHIEAGLRSFNKKMPEEVNRVLTDHISDSLFTPTSIASKNLINEGIDESKIFEFGDVMLDSSLHFKENIKSVEETLGRFGLSRKKYILVTLHRPSNVDEKEQLFKLLTSIDAVGMKSNVVFPVHPRTRNRIEEFGIDTRQFEHIHFIEPLGYLDMIVLESEAELIVTDSGGVQKEAYFYRVPCVTLRDETEWLELISSGWNYLLSPRSPKDQIVQGIIGRINQRGEDCQLYGGGDASKAIASQILRG